MKKEKVISPPSKVVIRHLPSGLTEEEFLEVVKPLPEHNWFSFQKANTDYGSLGFCRAYINFCNHADIYGFRDQFDGYVFVDGKGNESPAVVEYAPFQKLAHRDASPKRPDPRMGTITSDPDYLQFLHALENPEPVGLPGTEKMLEDMECSADENAKTPLVEYIEQRRLEILRKLQNRSQFDKLNTRQLERVLKKEERKEYVRLRRAEKRRLRMGERGARRYGKQPTEDDLDDDYDEYEDLPPPPSSKVKGLSPRAERASSSRASEVSAKVKARRDKKVVKKLLPEKDRPRRPEAEARLYDKEASLKLDSKKIVVIKRRVDTAELAADVDARRSSQHTSTERLQEISILSSEATEDSKNSSSDLHQSILDETGESEAPIFSSPCKTGDESDAGIAVEISTYNSNSSDASLPASGNLSLDSRISAASDETSQADLLCTTHDPSPDDDNESSLKDGALINTEFEASTHDNDDINSNQHFTEAWTNNDDTTSFVNDACKNQSDAHKDVVSSDEHSEASEPSRLSSKESKLPGVSAVESPSAVDRPCDDVRTGPDSDVDIAVSTDAAFGASVEATIGASETHAAISASTEVTADASPTDSAFGASVDAGIDASVDAGIDASVDAGIDASADAGIDASVDAGIDASADAGIDASADAGIDASADMANTSDEPPRTTESGDDTGKTGADPRTVRKIRNKDRPAMQLYRPGQCRLSSARLKQDNGVATTKDTSSSHSSTPSPVMSGAIHDLPHQSSTAKRSDDSQPKSQGNYDSHQLARGSTEGMSRGKDRLARDEAPSLGGSSSAGRGERAGPPKKKPAKTLEFTSQRHQRGGGGRGSDHGRGRYGQPKHEGDFKETRGTLKSTSDGEASAAPGSGEASQARGSDGAATAGGVVKSQGKRYSRMRPVEK